MSTCTRTAGQHVHTPTSWAHTHARPTLIEARIKPRVLESMRAKRTDDQNDQIHLHTRDKVFRWGLWCNHTHTRRPNQTDSREHRCWPGWHENKLLAWFPHGPFIHYGSLGYNGKQQQRDTTDPCDPGAQWHSMLTDPAHDCWAPHAESVRHWSIITWPMLFPISHEFPKHFN